MENIPIILSSKSKSFDSTQIDNLDLTSTLHEKKSFKEWITTFKTRHILTVYAFFGFFFAYSMRAQLSVAIVEMTKHSRKNITNTTVEWSPLLQGYILSSFFYGYIITQLPAAFLTTKYGGRWFFGAGIGICSFLSLLMPAATYLGAGYLISLRVLQGLTQGFIFPAMHCLWSKWSPPYERSSLATFAFSGSYIGSLVSLSLSGLIAEHINWQAIFYLFGTFGLLWSILWFIFIFESPAEHTKIRIEERLFIESSLVKTNIIDNKIPWKLILTSAPVWAIVFAHFAENWGFYTFLTEMPTFLSNTINYKIDKAGFISSMPYLLMAILLYASGYLSDYILKTNKMSYTFVRKLFCCSGLCAQAFFMILMALTNNSILLIICINLSIGFGGLPWSSFGVNHLDIGAGFANVLMSISNTFATLPGIISPILTGHLVENKTKSEWNIVFWISSIINLIGSILFLAFASGETQSWAVFSASLHAPNSNQHIEISDLDNKNFNLNDETKPSYDAIPATSNNKHE